MNQPSIRSSRARPGAGRGNTADHRRALGRGPAAMAAAYHLALARFHAEFATATRTLPQQTQLRDWADYMELLDETTVTTTTAKALHESWEDAYRKKCDLAFRKYSPDTPTPIEMLRADSVSTFALLLKTLAERSGVSALVIAERTPFDGPGKIGVSQVYYMINPRRRSLPRKEDQVRSFGEACGLDELQIQRLLEVWSQLKNQARVPAAGGPDGRHQSEPTRQGTAAARRGTQHAGEAPQLPAGEDLLRWAGELSPDGVTDSESVVALVALGFYVFRQLAIGRGSCSVTPR